MVVYILDSQEFLKVASNLDQYSAPQLRFLVGSVILEIAEQLDYLIPCSSATIDTLSDFPKLYLGGQVINDSDTLRYFGEIRLSRGVKFLTHCSVRLQLPLITEALNERWANVESVVEKAENLSEEFSYDEASSDFDRLHLLYRKSLEPLGEAFRLIDIQLSHEFYYKFGKEFNLTFFRSPPRQDVGDPPQTLRNRLGRLITSFEQDLSTLLSRLRHGVDPIVLGDPIRLLRDLLLSITSEEGVGKEAENTKSDDIDAGVSKPRIPIQSSPGSNLPDGIPTETAEDLDESISDDTSTEAVRKKIYELFGIDPSKIAKRPEVEPPPDSNGITTLQLLEVNDLLAMDFRLANKDLKLAYREKQILCILMYRASKPIRTKDLGHVLFRLDQLKGDNVEQGDNSKLARLARDNVYGLELSLSKHMQVRETSGENVRFVERNPVRRAITYVLNVYVLERYSTLRLGHDT